MPSPGPLRYKYPAVPYPFHLSAYMLHFPKPDRSCIRGYFPSSPRPEPPCLLHRFQGSRVRRHQSCTHARSCLIDHKVGVDGQSVWHAYLTLVLGFLFYYNRPRSRMIPLCRSKYCRLHRRGALRPHRLGGAYPSDLAST